MTETPLREEIVDITGPQGESLFWQSKKWALEGNFPAFQKTLDDTWAHYQSITDPRLVALVGALCVEGAIDALLISFAPGFNQCVGDTSFTFSVKLKVLRSLRVIPSRIVGSCDLVRQIRNAFAHGLGRRSFEELEPTLRAKLLPHVTAFNNAKRDPLDYYLQFRDLVGFIVMGLWIYTQQASQLRTFVDSTEGQTAFTHWVESRARDKRTAS